jgi:hypothetical protein
MNEHTPTPWFVSYRDEASNELVITDDEAGRVKSTRVCHVMPRPHYHDNQSANAAFIVQAVNSYQAMREALEQLLKAEPMQQGERNGYIMGVISQAIDMAKAALALTQDVEVAK